MRFFPRGNCRRVFSTLVIISAAVVLAVLVPEVSIVFSLLGATCTTFISQILPCMLYIRLSPGGLKVHAARVAHIRALSSTSVTSVSVRNRSDNGNGNAAQTTKARSSSTSHYTRIGHKAKDREAGWCLPFDHLVAVCVCSVVCLISFASVAQTIRSLIRS